MNRLPFSNQTRMGVVMEQRPIIALLYDFDKTLCTTDMQNYAFIPRNSRTC